MSSLQGARVLITGGAGFVGSQIADKLIDSGASRIVILDNLIRGSRQNLAYAIASERVELIEGDVRDAELVSSLMEGVDVVFHQSALRITHCAQEPMLASDVMHRGLQNVLEAATRWGVSKVVAASSASVYGEPSYLPIDEGHPFNNRTLYGALKIGEEQMLRAYAEMSGLRYLALRPFNIYGPRMDIHGLYTEVMIRWLQRLSEGESPIIFGDGSQTMDFIHVEDVARAYLLAAESDETDDVFNVGSGTDTSLLELCSFLCEEMGVPDAKPEFKPPRSVNPVSRRLASTAHIRECLGFEPRIKLREGLQDLVRWYKTPAGAV